MAGNIRQVKVRASELQGRGWLNTGGTELNLASLRGKIVILDFWTFCCMNCLHVLDELRPLEQKFADVLVTVGVHSPKFEHEADAQALAAAVDRYGIEHPVLDDPELKTWQAYTARAWPTLVVIDPEGYVVAHLSGEGHAQGLESLVGELIVEHEAKGTLHRGSGPYIPRSQLEGTFAFPGKAVQLPPELSQLFDPEQSCFLVTDTARHRIVCVGEDLETELAVFGGSAQKTARGWQDGTATEARFNEPQGLALVPAELRAELGYDVVVADSVNHLLRGITLATGQVRTLAGNGKQRLIDGDGARSQHPNGVEPGNDPLSISLSSPWDVLWSTAADCFLIAMAGIHQLWSFDPRTGQLAAFAGTGNEGLKDAVVSESWFAQSSGLAQDSSGTVWVADSETSALRAIRFPGVESRVVPGVTEPESVPNAEPRVETIVGLGLFDFGFVDGDRGQARMQHCLGVAVLPDDSVAIADTYNGAIRRFDPATAELTTLTRGLQEPSDVLVERTEDGARLIVVEANAHRVIRVPLPEQAQRVNEGAMKTARAATMLAGETLELIVRFSAPTGQKLDTRWGDPTQLTVDATPPEFILDGTGLSQGLQRTLVLNPNIADAVLHITARAAACDGEPGGEIPEHAACHLYQQDWGIPVHVTGAADDARELVLDLRGVNRE